jgi:hypothetical protein
MIFSENRFPSRIKSGTGFFGIVRVEGVMVYSSTRLPSRFPVGTKFVIEGKRAGEGEVQVFKRYLEFPDGTHVRLPARPGKRKNLAAHRVRSTRHGATEPAQRLSGQA